jgi:hypothetical protein
MFKRVLPALALYFLSLPAWSQTEAPTAPQAAPAAPTLDNGEPTPLTVLVSGSRPGPGLWKISKDEHVMWVFGSYSPLPAKMEWHSRNVEKVIANSQEYLKSPGSLATVGALRGLTALPFLIGAKKNPDGAELKDILPPDIYARWQPLKQKYFNNDDGIERERPTFVASELYARAMRDAGFFGGGNLVQKKIESIVEKHKIKVTDARYKVEIRDPGQALRTFKKSALDDVPCLVKTMESLDTDVNVMRTRANAWAIGDLDEIRKLNFDDRTVACDNALTTSSVAQNQPELRNMRETAAVMWIAAAEKALATNASTFTVVPIREILDPKGVIATLQRKGYTVEPPQ